MAPEKIWVTPSELTVLLAEKRNTYDIAYIRKDIVDETIKTAEDHAYFAGQEKFRKKLIEWLEEMSATYAEPEISETYLTVIDKLNSM